MEKAEFIGRHYEDKEKSELKDKLENWSQESLSPVDGELEKTENDIKMVEVINTMLKDELSSLNIEDYQPIPLERIHILPGEIFLKKFPNFEGKAFFLSTSDVVYINKNKVDTKARFLSSLLHELVHRASAKKFYADKEGGVSESRVGYRVRSDWKSIDRQNRLMGFNELMNDYTVYKILLKNQKILNKNIGISQEDIRGPIYTYMHYGQILESIINEVAKNKNISVQQVFDDFEKGQFQSSILVLKDVEHIFGKGSLDLLSLLGTLKKKEYNDKLETIIKKFFAESDKSKRKNIHQKIKEFIDEIEKFN